MEGRRPARSLHPPWLMRLPGGPSLLCMPTRVRLAASGSAAAVVLHETGVTLLPRPGSTWILEKGSFSRLMKTVTIRTLPCRSVMIVAAGAGDPSEG